MNIGELTAKYKFQSNQACNIYFLVDKILVFINFPGYAYPTMYIPTVHLRELVNGVPLKILESEPGSMKGFCMIGGAYLAESKFEAKVVVPKLIDFVSKADVIFNSLLDGTQDKSEAFSKFLLKVMIYKDSKNDTAGNLGMSYYWLIGKKRQSKGFVSLPFLEKTDGVFVDPQDKHLPIYSSSLFAQMAAVDYKEKYGFDLNLFEIPCLGCFLNGLALTVGRKIADTTFLDNKWKIQYYVSDQGNYKVPNHFIIHDEQGMNDFALVGCMEQGIKSTWSEIEYAKKRKYIVNNIMLWA